MAKQGKEGPRAYEAGPSTESDNLRDRYTFAADDGKESAKMREAGLLFSVAEAHLDEAEHEEAMTAAESALNIFREIEECRGVADSLRLVVHCMRAMSEEERSQGRGLNADDLLIKGESMAEEELANFRESGDERGQAAMLLSIAEVGCASRGTTKRDEALAAAEDARALFNEVSDTKMEALCCNLLCEVLFRKRNVRAARAAGEEAAELYKSIGDLKGQGRALHLIAYHDIRGGPMESALRSCRKSVRIFQELADKRHQALSLMTISDWYLMREDGRGALKSAEAAMELLQDVRKSQTLEATVVGHLVEANLQVGNPKQALIVAQEAADKFEASGHKREVIRVLQNLMRAQYTAKDYESAIITGEHALEMCRDIGDRRLEGVVLEEIAHVHLYAGNLEKAKEVAEEAVGIIEELPGLGPEEICTRLQVLTKILVWKDDYREALDEINKARALAQELDERNLEAFALSAACRIHALLDNFDKALKAGELATEIYHEEGDRRGEARAWEGLAEVYLVADDYSSAMRCAHKAQSLADDLEDKRLAAKMRQTQATIHLNFHELEEAQRAAGEAVKISRADDDMRGTVRSLFLLLEANIAALVDMSSKDNMARQARQLCEKSLRLAKESVSLSIRLDDKFLEAGATYWLGNIYLTQERLDEAIQAIETSLSLGREVEDKTLEIRALALKVQYMVRKKDMTEARKLFSEVEVMSNAMKDSFGKELVDNLRDMLAKHGKGDTKKRVVEEYDDDDAPQAATGGGASSTAIKAYSGPDPNMVKSYIIAMVKTMAGNDSVDAETPLMESGIDSLASVELRTQLQKEFRITLPSTVMFNYPTITGMTDLIVNEVTNKNVTWTG